MPRNRVAVINWIVIYRIQAWSNSSIQDLAVKGLAFVCSESQSRLLAGEPL